MKALLNLWKHKQAAIPQACEQRNKLSVSNQSHPCKAGFDIEQDAAMTQKHHVRIHRHHLSGMPPCGTQGKGRSCKGTS
ncbi:hypothetical protein KFY57_26135, partial [Salmonella enterica subsp. enterica serovar Typhimurium]|nr:hypothetical protein [Salmonella enterica subsp. enterica serovar Typhimurium]